MARKFSNARKAPANAAFRRRKRFERAVQLLASRLGAPRVSISGTPISIFRSRCTTVLKRVRAGRIEVVTQNGEPFVLLSLRSLGKLDTHPEISAR